MSRDDHLPILTKEVAQEALELVKAMFECNLGELGFQSPRCQGVCRVGQYQRSSLLCWG